MPFENLTNEQKNIVAEYTRQQRAIIGEFARLLNHMSVLDAMYDGQVVSSWASLASSDIIADGSGLAGVSELTKAQAAQIATAIQTILTTYNTTALWELYVRMAGATNTF